jgi:hypothetical protein
VCGVDVLTPQSPWRGVVVVLAVIVVPVAAFATAIELTDEDPPAADDGSSERVGVGDVVEGEVAPGGRDTFELDAEGPVTVTVDGEDVGFALVVVDEEGGERSFSDPVGDHSTLPVQAGGSQTITVEDVSGEGGPYTLSVVEGAAEGPVTSVPAGIPGRVVPLPPSTTVVEG